MDDCDSTAAGPCGHCELTLPGLSAEATGRVLAAMGPGVPEWVSWLERNTGEVYTVARQALEAWREKRYPSVPEGHAGVGYPGGARVARLGAKHQIQYPHGPTDAYSHRPPDWAYEEPPEEPDTEGDGKLVEATCPFGSPWHEIPQLTGPESREVMEQFTQSPIGPAASRALCTVIGRNGGYSKYRHLLRQLGLETPWRAFADAFRLEKARTWLWSLDHPAERAQFPPAHKRRAPGPTKHRKRARRRG